MDLLPGFILTFRRISLREIVISTSFSSFLNVTGTNSPLTFENTPQMLDRAAARHICGTTEIRQACQREHPSTRPPHRIQGHADALQIRMYCFRSGNHTPRDSSHLSTASLEHRGVAGLRPRGMSALYAVRSGPSRSTCCGQGSLRFRAPYPSPFELVSCRKL